MSTIIVCGGRSYGIMPKEYGPEDRKRFLSEALHERERLQQVLAAAIGRLGAKRFVMGDATGADALAARWCEENAIAFKVYPADWDQHGSKAGPIRNRQMLEQELPSAVIAFPGSRGTRNMCDIAGRAGVRVIKVDW